MREVSSGLSCGGRQLLYSVTWGGGLNRDSIVDGKDRMIKAHVDTQTQVACDEGHYCCSHTRDPTLLCGDADPSVARRSW